MIIGKVDNILIDSSLLDHMSVSCNKYECPEMKCCGEGVSLFPTDIEKINKVIDKVCHSLPPESADWIKKAGYVEIANITKTVSSDVSIKPHCIFFDENRCKLDKFLCMPKRCKAYPILLSESNVLSVEARTLEGCTVITDVPVYKTLREKITTLLGLEFYKKLETTFLSDKKYFKEKERR